MSVPDVTHCCYGNQLSRVSLPWGYADGDLDLASRPPGVHGWWAWHPCGDCGGASRPPGVRGWWAWPHCGDCDGASRPPGVRGWWSWFPCGDCGGDIAGWTAEGMLCHILHTYTCTDAHLEQKQKNKNVIRICPQIQKSPLFGE